MFEASVDDENTGQSAFGTEFYNEPLDNHDWDTDRSFVPQVISPSSLSSFHNASEGNTKYVWREAYLLIMILVQESSLLIKHHFGISLRLLRQSLNNKTLQQKDNCQPIEISFIRRRKQYSRTSHLNQHYPKNPLDHYLQMMIAMLNVSFGNQSVFSDITESEMSASMTHASIDLRRRARESKKSTSPSQQSRKSTAGNPRQQLFNVYLSLF